ncbi:MAG: fibrobacter succinogenes major paralogous domain-containing protein [Bacteroidia bacterium]|nr:fibrobacter succinogenes major paralogous domain-containing protein [Bacteroidia bacterium]
MKNLFRISGVILVILSIFLIHSCKKDKSTPPIISTTDVTAISYTTATSGGAVTNEGGAPVTARGVCWNTSADPTIKNSVTTENGGLGTFTSNITLLTPNTMYYVRAFAMNSTGIGYGNQVKFTTSQVAVPVLTTTAISSITQTTAISGGNITTDNGGSVTARGVCWSTIQNPTISDSKTSDVSGTGSFTSTITGLIGNTTYYVRAYATNSVGSAYGNQVSFKTSPLMSVLTTATTSSITSTTASGGGNITNDGGTTITARGVCWGTVTNPTTANNKTTDGTGTGTFTSSITGLTANTTYYIRAYATNSVGTNYGNELSFITLATIPTLTTTAVTAITETTATGGGNITSDGGATITARGVCWGTVTNPTTANNKTTDGTGTGTFTSSITGLTANTTYYVRAYTTNSIGTVYGNQVSFTTSPLMPTLSTDAISSITATSCNSGGTISSDGGASITAKGVCWGTSDNPTVALSTKTMDGTGTGTFLSNITGLTANTTYHVRAYATNSAGTSYGGDRTFTTLISGGSTTVTDIDGNGYNTVTIGTQVWMAENLKTIKYNDGTAIPLVTDGAAWAALSTPGYCWYNNDAATYKATYGALYNWFTVNTGKLCPTGWHVPSDTEWTTLTTYLGGTSVAGGKLKESGTAHWDSPNTGATNETGFTALPGGFRSYSNPGGFGDIGKNGSYWSSTDFTINGMSSAWYQYMYYSYSWAYRYYSYYRREGFPVRCVKD